MGQTLQESTAKWALVFEDDIINIFEDFEAELDVVLGRLPKGWLICYLGFHTPQGGSKKMLRAGEHVSGPYRMPSDGGWVAGLWCYLISRAGADTMLREVVPFKAQVDAHVGIFAVEAGQCYCLQPGEFLAFSRATEVSRDTDIQTFPED